MNSDDDDATQPRRPEETPTVALQPTPHQGRNEFAPGEIVAERYRIVSLIGAGGMGQVYRADDLKLGHPVALKFLVALGAQNAERVTQLISEVRIGRQVAHPNVCRIYDIVEWRGLSFITMEYLEGEDFESLLRRIGRLPIEKATAVARDICAGLAAAHTVGVIHRDLKPANVILDSRGVARITDFGLAVLQRDSEATDTSGTPAYMAPEQFAGTPASVSTDIYSLGLLLHELFSGKRVHSPDEVRQRSRLQQTPRPKPLTELAPSIDPAIARAVTRCLSQDPAERPGSAREVLAALPAIDALDLAEAKGETPTPEMVAAAGDNRELPIQWRGRFWPSLQAS